MSLRVRGPAAVQLFLSFSLLVDGIEAERGRERPGAVRAGGAPHRQHGAISVPGLMKEKEERQSQLQCVPALAAL